ARGVARTERTERRPAASESDIAQARAVTGALGEHGDQRALTERDAGDDRLTDGVADHRAHADPAADDRADRDPQTRHAVAYPDAEADDDNKAVAHPDADADGRPRLWLRPLDRKSTRLNSS